MAAPPEIVSSALLRTVCAAFDARCTNSTQITLLRLIASEYFSSKFSGQVCNSAQSVRRAFVASKKKNLGAYNCEMWYFDCLVVLSFFSGGDELSGFACWPSKWSLNAQGAKLLKARI